MAFSDKVSNRTRPVTAVPLAKNHLPINQIENWRNFNPINAGRFQPLGTENLIQAAKDLSPGFSGHVPGTEDTGISAEEHRKMIAEWLITWLKEGDARLVVH